MEVVKQLSIRTYKPEDKPSILSLNKQGLISVGMWQPNGNHYDDLECVEDAYLKNGTFLIGESNGRIIAMVGLRKVTDEIAEVMRMQVDPEFRRRGYGTMILTELETKAKKLGYRKLILFTSVTQTAAQALYAGCGYVEVKREPYKSQDLETMIVHYEKELEKRTTSEETGLGMSRRDAT
jgi:ribosomal protein S18 acetylase RimI-like enzyme